MIIRRSKARVVGTFLTLMALFFSPFASAQAKEPRIVIFSASLATGFGIPKSQGLVPKLQSALDRRGIRAKIINRSRNGRTTSAGARAISTILSARPDAVIVSLGGNDILRRHSLERTQRSVDAITATLAARNIPMLITSMKPGRGSAQYRRDFPRVFASAARRHNALYLPDFYGPLANRNDRKLFDRIHPNAKGVDALVARMLPKVIALVKRAR